MSAVDGSEPQLPAIAGHSATPVTPSIQNFHGYSIDNQIQSPGLPVYDEDTVTVNSEDLDDTIECYRCFLEVTEDGHPEKLDILDDLATSLYARFECRGEPSDLQELLSLRQLADSLTPVDSPDKPRRLKVCAVSMIARFARDGMSEDLNDAIALQSRAAMLLPDMRADKPELLNDLGISLKVRFEHSGNTGDLDDAISSLYDAVKLTPDDNSNKPRWLMNLGTLLQRRFDLLENLRDIEEAVQFHNRSVRLAPSSHYHHPICLVSAACSLQKRFERLENLEDLAEAVRLHSSAADVIHIYHPNKSSSLTCLAASLQCQYERKRDTQDLKDEIAHQIRTANSTPAGHLSFTYSDNLHNEMEHLPETYSQQSRSVDDCDSAFGHQYGRGGYVVDATTSSTPCSARPARLLRGDPSQRAQNLRSLGIRFLIRLRSPYAHASDAVHAMEAFREIIRHPVSPPLERMQAFDYYAQLLSEFPNLFGSPPRPTILEAYERALDLIPQCISLGNGIRGRYASKELRVVGGVSNNAATAAIMAKEYGLALEWLEAGRAVVWSQLLQLHAPMDDLRSNYPHLAMNLHRISQALQRAGDSTTLPASTEAEFDAYSPSQSERHSYALEYEKLIERIRKLEGFENFMRPKKLSHFATACTSGPVVVINVNKLRCDALVLCRAGDVLHVPLPDFSLSCAQNLQTLLWDFLSRSRLLSRWRDSLRDECEVENRGGRVMALDAPEIMRKLLAMLWKLVVKPIIDVVYTVVPHNGILPHITWCPTGPLAFLPLHAAGIYPRSHDDAARSQNIMDLAVSSYTPTLQTLLKLRTRTAPNEECPKTLIVSQPNTPGHPPISGTTEEATSIASMLNSPATTILGDERGTIKAVLEGMQMFNWVHLACHGMQDRKDSVNSAFALHDGRLTIEMLMSTKLLYADLAVLSACQTATGDEKLPEEAVHLAAGMLNIGFKSVIGTMWSIDDRRAPIVMREFYRVMMAQVKEGGELQPAYALHEATKALRAKYGVTNFVEWIPFVHFGL